MNYITDGTFWVVVILICAAIGIVFYILNKKIEETNKNTLQTFKEVTMKMADGIDGILVEMDEQHKKDIMGVQGRTFTPDDIEKMVEKTIKKRTKR